MRRKAVSGILLTLMLMGVALASDIPSATASGIIHIRADGSIDPQTAPIYTADNITYFLADNIYTDYGYDGLVVERSNIIIDGDGYTLQGDSEYGMGVLLSGLSNVTVQNINIRGFANGIYIDSSASVTISSGNVSAHQAAISLINSPRNTVSKNRIWGLPDISLESSSYNSIYANILDGSELCAKIWIHPSSNNNEIYQNKVVIGDVAICVEGSNNRVWSNEIVCEEGVYLTGSHNVVIGNKLGGAYIGGFNNTVEGNDEVYRIVVIQGANNTFSRNRCLLSYYVSLEGFNHIVAGNDIYGVMYDLRLEAAFGCTISGNRMRYADSGVSIASSSNNVICGNNITDNWHGIEINAGAANNYIFHNNFVANTQQVLVTASKTVNIWDDSYPSGGNYWSDYAGVDVKSGSNQDQLGSDGIGDTPLVIDAQNLDHYPLMNPWMGIVTATVDIKPDSLSLKSRSTWITAYIELPAPYSPEGIDVYTVELNGVVQAEFKPIAIGDYDDDGILDLMVKFKGAKVMPQLHMGTNRLTVTGKVNCILFEGIDTIKVQA